MAPGRRPAKAFETLETGADVISLLETVAIEPMTFTFFSLPYPTTTTSFKDVLSVLIVVLMTVRLLIGISILPYPTEEMTKVPLEGALIEYIPFDPVEVPFVPPFTLIETPAIGLPVC